MVTAETIRTYLNSYSKHVTHWAVAHTDFHTYQRSERQIAAMATEASKQVRHFRNCFNQFLYQAKSKRKPALYQPLMLTTIEGARDTAVAAHTIHFNFALGNIPACISTEELQQVFRHCWIDKAGLGEDVWLQDAEHGHSSYWISYITKEAERGRIETWDFENTQIPYLALAAD